MKVEEFSNGFDLLVSSYRRFRDFDSREPLDTIEFDEYEKSQYLTKAQEEIVLSLYNGKNPFGESFEQTEELRRYLENLVVDATEEPIPTSNNKPLGIDSKSKFFTLPEDLWFIIYEQATVDDTEYCDGMGAIGVYPIRHDEYLKIRKNPFRGANNRRALRLDLSDGVVEIICKFNISGYYLRYLKKLSPIVLVNLPNGLKIGEKNTVTECAVHESLHQRILERAVEMGMRDKVGNIASGKSQRNSENNK